MISPLKRSLFRFFFGIESLLFIWTYLFGMQGIHVIITTQRENERTSKEISSIRQDIIELEHTITQWKNNQFFKEKYAREHLQMARAKDLVYFVE